MAVLLPVGPYVLELRALRRLTTAAFGTLTSLEPAFALLAGVLLHRATDTSSLLGVPLVVAGIGAARAGGRAMAVA